MSEKVVYLEPKTIYKCQHVEETESSGYLSLWAGENVRFHVCRLCTNLFLGAIVTERVKEAINEKADAELGSVIKELLKGKFDAPIS